MKECLHDGQTRPNQSDWQEINLFKRYIRLEKKYGFEALFRRKFWRVYMGFKETDKLNMEEK